MIDYLFVATSGFCDKFLKNFDNFDPENRFFRPDDRFNVINIVTHSLEVIKNTFVLGNI